MIPIAFRCTLPQLQRVEALRRERRCNRSALIVEALTHFLHYAESREARRLDLFRLVERIETRGDDRAAYPRT